MGKTPLWGVARLVGGWGALGLRTSPTHRVGNTPQWGVAHPPGGQRPITLEYQIYLPAIDTIVTGLSGAAIPWFGSMAGVGAGFAYLW